MNISNRRRMLAVARWLDKLAAGIRKRVKDGTPKRQKKATA